MTREQAFECYFQGCKDMDPLIDERTARIYFDQWWGRRLSEDDSWVHQWTD